VDAHIHTSKVKVPFAVVYGHFEYLTDEELHDIITDLDHERTRRVGGH